MIGGAFAYGFVGLFIGPTLLAVSFRLWQHWAGEPTPPASQRPGDGTSRAGS